MMAHQSLMEDGANGEIGHLVHIHVMVAYNTEKEPVPIQSKIPSFV